MTNYHRFRCGGLAAALGLALLTGCQHTNQRSYSSPTPLADAEPPPKLNATQVADVQVALARDLEHRGQADQAEEQYRQALKLDPARADAWLRLAVLLDRQGRFQDSAAMYAKVLAARPGDPGAYANMGYSLYLQGRFEEAERNLRQAIALRPEYGRAHTNLGLLLARTGRDDEALAEFQKAGCSACDARCNLAFALTLERHLPEARKQYEQALAVSPTSTPAQTGLRQLEALVAKMDAAARGTESTQQQAGDAAPAAPLHPEVVPAAWHEAKSADEPPTAAPTEPAPDAPVAPGEFASMPDLPAPPAPTSAQLGRPRLPAESPSR